MEKKPVLGITMGDPFGIGPELTVRALANAAVFERCRPFVIGDMSSMEHALAIAKRVHGIDLKLNRIEKTSEARFSHGTIDVLDLGVVPVDKIPTRPDSGKPMPYNVGACALGGEAAFRYIRKAIDMALRNEIDAVVTNAISKEAINMAGHHYAGHTEIFADFTGADKYSMMLAHEDLRVVHVSTHVSLREACDLVKKDRVLDCIRIAHQACRSIGIKDPRIGVAGLNPHCGENGLFGSEEIEEIQPAIDRALSEGINIPDRKPVPPDNIFSKALGGWYDIVVAMYHDQGHIPLKFKGFVYNRKEKRWEAVAGINVTLGLPIIRVSVDHGTGYDIAGTGQAVELSLLNAIDYAILMANNRKM